MDFAKDRSGNTHKATEAKKGYFICIHCKGDVRLAKGRKKNPYFFHLHDRHPGNCDEYIKSHYIPGTLAGNSNSVKTLEKFQSNYKLDLEINTKNFPHLWSLQLDLPHNRDLIGHSVIINNGKEIKTINLDELKIRSITLPMHPHNREYTIITQPRNATYFNIDENIRGLDNNLNFFNSNKYKNKRYSPSSKLKWGYNYYVIWNGYLDIPKFIDIQVSDYEIKGWKCGLINLPDDENLQIKEWVQTNSNLQLEKEKIFIQVLSQGFSKFNSYDHATMDNEDFLISLKRTSQLLDNEIDVEIDDNTYQFNFDKNNIIYLNANLDNSYMLIKYEGDTYYFSHEENLIKINKIDSLCNFTFNYKKEKIKISLFDKNFKNYLKFFLDKKSSIENISYLPLVDFNIQIDGKKLLDEKKIDRIKFTPMKKNIDEEILKKINNISTSINNFCLKFGNFISYEKIAKINQKFNINKVNKKLLIKYLILSNDQKSFINVKKYWGNDQKIINLISKLKPNLQLKKIYNNILNK